MSRRVYVTTPIYYVNDVPHLGTAYTTIAADALRRYHLLRGHDCRMLTGTDEHGLKIEREATSLGISPSAFVDGVSARFRTAWPQLGVKPDDFIRTTEPRHKALVSDLWKRVEASGDLYLGSYEDWYCVGCESFKTEKELTADKHCPLHARPVEKVKEETYFFRLSAYRERLLAHYEANPGFIEPEGRRNEVLSFVRGELRDLSVSRTSFRWGVPVPGNERHVMYVWFDALANYWTALGGPASPLSSYWPPTGEVIHLMGKDILRFHAVYWPAFLMSAGVPLPTKIFAHGFLTIDGQKMSKSLRNAVDPIRLAREIGVDVLRYHLLRAIAFGQDGDFDHAALIERYNADLAKNLGNLLSRTLGLAAKLCGNRTPAFGVATPLESEFIQQVEALSLRASEAWEGLAPHRGLELSWEACSLANQYVDRAAPWAEAKKDGVGAERVATILATLLEFLRMASVWVAPAMPSKSAEMRAQLGVAPLAALPDRDIWPMRFSPRNPGEPLGMATALFPTIDKDAERFLLETLAPHSVGNASLAVAAGSSGEATMVSPKDAKKAPEPAASTVSIARSPVIPYETFAEVDLRVGVVRTAERVPKKDKLLRLSVDIGEEQPRTIIAGLAQTFAPEGLVGRTVIVVANLAPRDFGKGLVSEGMLLATGPSDDLRLADAPGAQPGARLK